MFEVFHRIHRELRKIRELLEQWRIEMSKAFDDLKAQVEQNTSVEQSAVTLIERIADQLESAGTDPVALADLQTSLRASADRLAAAVSANTPAEQPPVQQPPVQEPPVQEPPVPGQGQGQSQVPPVQDPNGNPIV